MDDNATPADRRLPIEELRERQLHILDVVLDHCRREDLRVYLCAGTLLGAVRHRGYIPWDDDIDVMLPRSDYEIFCRTFWPTRQGERLSVRSLATCSTYPLPFAKVCDDRTVLEEESDIVRDLGVNIDVFPIDGWCDGARARSLQRAAIAVLAQAIRVKHLARRRRRGFVRDTVLAVAKLVLAWLPARQISWALTWTARRGACDSRSAGVAVWGKREMIPRRCLGAASTVSFEGRQCPAPADPDTVLRISYGNYLELPTADKRTSRHRFVAYLREQEPLTPVAVCD